eukprot:GHVL01019485.1.p1 GENE.GHVL01019485.1~~GHVL01019485.1.p1  ORF type:complete len:1182 (-),score=200.61 GHVL01019485.1:1132-4545(-)
MESAFAEESSVHAAVPRWISSGFVTSATDANKPSIVVIGDTFLERKYGFGNKFTGRNLGDHECYMSGSVLRTINVRPLRGDVVNIYVDLIDVLENIGGNVTTILEASGLLFTEPVKLNVSQFIADYPINSGAGFNFELPQGGTIFVNNTDLRDEIVRQNPNIIYDIQENILNEAAEEAFREALRFNYNATPIVGVDDPLGKWTKALGNVVFLDRSHLKEILDDSLSRGYEYFTDRLSDVLESSVNLPIRLAPQAVKELTQNATFPENISNLALTVELLYNDRFKSYTQGAKKQKKKVIEWSDTVFNVIGVNSGVTVDPRVYNSLKQFEMLRFFIDNLFVAIIAFLAILSSLLIYSLTMNNIETKTMELGMLRFLGLRKFTLIHLLLIEAASYAFPGLILGLLVSFLITYLLTYFISINSYYILLYKLSYEAILLGICIAIIIPIISNIVPIRKALGTTLRDALDAYRQSAISDLQITITRLKGWGFSPVLFVTSILLTLSGFISYYLIPYTFTFLEFQLFLAILNVILFGMLLGLSILFQVFQKKLQNIFLWLLIVPFRVDKDLLMLVSKNLAAHANRNQKTALMFCLTLTFLVFAGVAFDMQGSSMITVLNLAFGSDIHVKALTFDRPLNEAELSNILLKYRNNVEDFSFATFPLAQHPLFRDTKVTNIVGHEWNDCHIRGISEKFFSSTFHEYLNVIEYDKDMGDMEKDDHSILAKSLFEIYENDPYLGKIVNIDEKNRIYRDTFNVTSGVRSIDRDPYFEREAIENESRKVTVNTAELEPLKVFIPEGMKRTFAIKTGTPFILNASVYGIGGAMRYTMLPRASIGKLAGFPFSTLPNIAFYPTILTTDTDIMRIVADAKRAHPLVLDLDPSVNSVKSIFGSDQPLWNPGSLPNDRQKDIYGIGPANIQSEGDSNESNSNLDFEFLYNLPMGKEILFVRLKADTLKIVRENILNDIRASVDRLTLVVDVTDVTKSVESGVDLLRVLFSVVVVVSLTLAFFLLWISTTGNIKENAWEIGVLRAVGLSKKKLIRIYIYESISITLSSIFMGSCVGIIIAITLQLQFSLFSDIVFIFKFPTILFFIMIILSLITTFVATYILIYVVLVEELLVLFLKYLPLLEYWILIDYKLLIYYYY